MFLTHALYLVCGKKALDITDNDYPVYKKEERVCSSKTVGNCFIPWNTMMRWSIKFSDNIFIRAGKCDTLYSFLVSLLQMQIGGESAVYFQPLSMIGVWSGLSSSNLYKPLFYKGSRDVLSTFTLPYHTVLTLEISYHSPVFLAEIFSVRHRAFARVKQEEQTGHCCFT